MADIIHKPAKSEFKRMAAQMDYVPEEEIDDG